METSSVQAMVRVGTSSRRISEALSSFRREDCIAVREAYSIIAREAEKASSSPLSPRGHAWYLSHLSSFEVKVLPLSRLDAVKREAEDGYVSSSDEEGGDVDDFDPCHHFLLATNLSPLSYLASDELGPGANVFSPHHKIGLAWWSR